VQWMGAGPVFIDVASFERLKPGEPWMGYRQFCQTFLYPLFLQTYKKIGYHAWLRGVLDGIDPRDCAAVMSLRDWLRPGVLSHVVLHAQLHARYSQRDTGMRSALPAAGFQKQMIKANVRKLQRIVRGLKWATPATVWTGYAAQNSYAESDQKRKVDFVRSAAQTRARNLVWDLGCNTGTYSRIAAENSEYVVAVDADHATIDRLYLALKDEQSRKILPLVGNLADASPDQGWRGLERKSLPGRGRPELVLCLALIHHLVIGAGIPLAEFIQWLADLKTDLVIEFVSREDPMVRLLLRNKPDDYADYDQKRFESLLSELFQVRRREALESVTRTLYFAEAKP
jgi:SAM-dependent methyltransferase